MKNRSRITTFLLISALFLLFVIGCSSGAGDDDVVIIDPDTVTIGDIAVEATPDSINVGQTSAVTASVYDASGNPIPGVQVSFTLNPASMASISPGLAVSGNDGVARATLTARNQQGNITVTASAGETTSLPKSLAILSGITPDQINVTSTPSTMLIRGTASIRAEVLDADGNPVPDGTAVSFAVSNTNFGSMSTNLATTINGFASSTFTALEQPGTATIEVSVGAINNSVDILINATQPAALQFVSADPQRIALQGSGGNESSDITFKVVDGSGNGVQGVSVLVNIEKSPNGGEYIDDDATPKEIAVSSDANGLALVTLRSGTIPGAVTLKGTITVDGVTFSTNASVVSIGGGVPTSSRFSISADPLNIAGLHINGATTDITAWMSDRYGNYNILEGTTVSFWSETALSVDASEATVTDDGTATVSARTQHPVLATSTGGLNVEPLPWEEDLVADLLADYGLVSPTGTHPRDGQVSVLAITQGEEYFRDENANGVYDSGEDFDDTHDDPFIDVNDNDTRDDGTGVDPFEEYTDSNVNPGWDSYNGIWDSQKDIFSSAKLLITGQPIIAILPTIPGFNIPNGGSETFTFIVCDRNLNYLSAGTVITLSIDGGGKVFGGPWTLADLSYLPGDDVTPAIAVASHRGQIEFTGTIADDAADEAKARNVAVTVTVSWEGSTYSETFFGVIN